MSIAFIHDINREIARLEAVIDAAKGAEATLGVLRGTVEMLQDVERGAISQKPSELSTDSNVQPSLVPQFDGGSLLDKAFPDTPERSGTACQAPSDDPEVQPAARSPYIPLGPRPSRTEPETMEITLADAAALEPVTKRQLDVFEALWKLHNAGTIPIIKLLTGEVGFYSGDAVESLCKKGYAKRNSNAYPHCFYPIATGTPRLQVAFAPKPIEGDAARGELTDDPAPGRSALDKKRAIDELDPVGYLMRKGHECKRITSDTYQLDQRTVALAYILALVNTYRGKEKLPPLDLASYL